MRLQGKIAVVTGAGSGIGRASALRFAQEGARVALADISQERGKETLRLVREAGGEGIFVRTDVSVAGDVERMVQETLRLLGGVHVLLSNAGVYSAQDRPITEIDEEVFDSVLNVNLKGMFLCCKYALPAIVRHGGGSAILVSSAAALIGAPTTAYSTSKGGVLALARALARQYAARGVRVNAVLPGPIDTPIHENVRAAQGRPSGDKSLGKTPFAQRWGQPNEVAALMAFLASDDSSFMTGAALTVDGGLTAA